MFAAGWGAVKLWVAFLVGLLGFGEVPLASVIVAMGVPVVFVGPSADGSPRDFEVVRDGLGVE